MTFNKTLIKPRGVDQCVWALTPTFPPRWLSLRESGEASWPRLSPALWLRGGRREERPADVRAGSPLCCSRFPAGSLATSCATCPPANSIIIIIMMMMSEGIMLTITYHTSRIFTRRALLTSPSPGGSLTADSLWSGTKRCSWRMKTVSLFSSRVDSRYTGLGMIAGLF